MESLDKYFNRGVIVTITSQGFSVALQLVSLVVLSRLLSRYDYGIIAMVTIVTSLAGLFRELGLSTAAIQKESLTHAQHSNLFWLNVGMGGLLTAIVSAISPLVSWFFDKPELLWVTIISSFSFLINSCATQHSADLARKLEFGKKAVASILNVGVSAAVSIILAVQGFSYWALVFGNLIGGVCQTIALLALSSFRPSCYRKGSGIRQIVKFGAGVTGFDLVTYTQKNIDKLLIGRVFGVEILGLYGRASTIINLPIGCIRNPVNAVGLPTLSKLQNHPEEFRKASRKQMTLIAWLSMPLCAFIGASSEWIIPLALGTGWEEAVSLLSILSVIAFIRPVCSIRGQVLLSLGDSKRYFRWGLANCMFRVMAVGAGIFWGIHGVVFSCVIVELLILYPSICYAFRYSPLKFFDFLQCIALPALASLFAVLLLIGVDLIALKAFEYKNSSIFMDVLLFSFAFVAVSCSVASGRRVFSRILRLIFKNLYQLKKIYD